MRLEILQVPECPSAALLDQRLDDALAHWPNPVQRAHYIVEDIDAATSTGMTGSPTLLLNGADPFREPGMTPNMSCRLYLHDDGQAQGAPSVAALHRALGLTTSEDNETR